MQEEVAAEQASQEETEEPEEEEEDPVQEGSLVDPQTGETVQLPDPETIDPEDDSVLGDTPVNDNLVDVEPPNATEEVEDENPTE